MSKELKAFYELKEGIEYIGGDFYCANEQRLNIIETALKKLKKIVMRIEKPELLKPSIDIVNKKLKAFEIIKEKRVDVELLMKTINAKDYNKYSKNTNISHNLGQREYELLKEVLS